LDFPKETPPSGNFYFLEKQKVIAIRIELR